MPVSYSVIKQRKADDPEYAARMKSYAEKYRELNREKEKERQRQVKARKRASDRDAYNAQMREYNKEKVYPKRAEEALEKKKANPEYQERVSTRSLMTQAEYWRHWKMKHSYGIGLDDYYKMYENQAGKCAICDEHCKNFGRDGLVVDHCHDSGKVRRLLCAHCNKGLGHFRDDIQRMTKAIEYLEHFKD